ncbi:hypothetical protein C8R45DRAFT_554957 [Mycena sanguinolenta]|nr:hypothetical protein C8R45DRAFT_554957 [Mycena sanguinolenta]
MGRGGGHSGAHSSPLIQALTANQFISACFRRLASRTEQDAGETQDALLRELVRLQSAHLPGFNRAVSSSLRAGPVTGMRWAFESEHWNGKRVLLLHVTDLTVPSAHSARIGALIERAGRNESNSREKSAPTPQRTPKTKKSKHAPPSNERVRVSLIADAGHALTWTHAREVREVVCKFLAGS